MKKKTSNEIIKRIAQKYGVSVNEVRRDMQAAIDAAYENPNNQLYDAHFSRKKPTIEEFIEHAKSKTEAE